MLPDTTLTSTGVSDEQTEAEPAPPAFAGTPRFQVLRPLGAGGMGVVYEVLDREQERAVALKLLRRPSPEGIIRLKDEFRALRDLHHENLVALGELCEHQGTWFFTMERVDGLPLVDRLRQPGVGPDEVRAAFAQVASALDVLHRAGKIHRDIKPANVLCTPAGRVVVLDFGLMVHAYRSVSARAGTRAYMAPEQERDEGPLGPAVDWYSVGVMLHEALVGERPQRPPADIPPSAPSTPAALRGAAEDLRALCAALLSPDPRQRPGSGEVLRRLGGSGDAAQAPHLPVLGREAELQALHAARAAAHGGALEVVLLEGESGIGKTALLSRFAGEVPAQQPDALVLQGRCHAQESIPYRAFDEIVDQLGRYLRELPAQEAAALLPADAALLVPLFPSLAQLGLRLGAVARSGEPVQRRLAAFAALRELLARLARRRPVLLLIDDVHWADVDSIALLRELVRQPEAPPLLVGLAGRPGAAQALAWLPLRRLGLGPLPPEAARSLAQLLRPGSPERAARLCQEAGGHPLFLSELACARDGEVGGPSLGMVLRARMERLGPSLRALLELMAVAGTPRPQRVLAAAAGMDAERFASAVAELRGHRLVRTAGLRLLDPIEPYHDQIREAASPGEERRRHCHLQLAMALEVLAIPDEEARAVHWAGAGVPDRARAHALHAAALAEEALAFDRAARLYRMALELRPEGSAEEPALLVKQGEALANARRGPEAAAALLRAAGAVDGQEALGLRQRAGHQLLSSGRIEEGLAVLREVLAVVDVSLPEASVRGIVSLLWNRLLLRLRGTGYRLRGEQELAAGELLRIDVIYTVAAGLGWIEPVRAAVLFTRGLLLSLRQGEPYRLMRALLAEAAFTALESIHARDRSASFLRLGEDLLQRRPAPGLYMGVLLTRSLIRFFSGQWREARALLEQAERGQEGALQGTLAWEMKTLQLYLVYSIIWLGDVREYARRVLLYQREAQERGDLLLSTYLGLAAAPVYLAWDQVEQARAAVDDALRRWPRRLDAAYAVAVVTQSEIDLYAGDGRSAYRRIQSHWGVFQRGFLMTVASLRIQIRCARVVSALRAAREDEDAVERRHLLRVVRRDIRALRREGLPYASALAQLFCAVALETEGDRDGALERLALVIPQLDAAEMSLYGAVARRYQGILWRDKEGEAQRHRAEDWMREQQIRDPAKISRFLAGV